MVAQREDEIKNSQARVFVVDDHPIVRRGLAQLVNHEADLTVCGEASDAAEALDRLEELLPDLVIVDLSLKGVDGLQLIKEIRLRSLTLPVLVLSIHSESLYAERVLRAGGQGYVMKEEAPENVLTAIRRVLGGEVYLSPVMQAGLLQRIVDGDLEPQRSPVESLSDRELEVFRLIGRGRGTREIADELQLSVKTIESHREHIKQKLRLETATQLVQHAVQWVREESGG